MYDKATEGEEEEEEGDEVGGPDGPVSANDNDATTPVADVQGSSRSKRARKHAPEMLTEARPAGRTTRSTPAETLSEEPLASMSQVLCS